MSVTFRLLPDILRYCKMSPYFSTLSTPQNSVSSEEEPLYINTKFKPDVMLKKFGAERYSNSKKLLLSLFPQENFLEKSATCIYVMFV